MQPKALILAIMLKFHITKAGKNSMAAYEISNQQEAGQQQTGNSPDLSIVGGGPSGSTISALPTEQGHDIVLLGKSRHSRFHIGESLSPLKLPMFERLGVEEQIASIGIITYGAEFDEILFKNAIARGACAREGCRVTGTGFRLMFFKIICYLQSMVMFKESYRAWLRRKRSIRGFAGELIAL
jgi:hypothetical protein